LSWLTRPISSGRGNRAFHRPVSQHSSAICPAPALRMASRVDAAAAQERPTSARTEVPLPIAPDFSLPRDGQGTRLVVAFLSTRDPAYRVLRDLFGRCESASAYVGPPRPMSRDWPDPCTSVTTGPLPCTPQWISGVPDALTWNVPVILPYVDGDGIRDGILSNRMRTAACRA
jgi:hypothetical protein